MKRFGSASCVAAVLALAACDRVEPPEGGLTAEAAPRTAGLSTGPRAPVEASAGAARPAAAGAPSFAVLYPGGILEEPPVAASGDGSTGGLVTYLTDADPAAVIAFHRRQAEAAGLASVMAMNQGDAKAYGAAKDQSNLQVVASPTPEGRTSVQLSWSATG